jgi:AsmA protein
MARILSITIGILLLVILLAAVLLPMLIDKDEVVALATDAVKEETGATLTIDGELELSIFPTLSIDFESAALTFPEKSEPDLEIGSASIGVQLMPLLSSQVEISRIAIDGVVVRTQSTPEDKPVDTSEFSDEQLDAYYAKRQKEREEANEASGAEAALAVPLALNVASLSVKNARIESLDIETDTTSIVVIDSLQASDLNLDGRSIPLELSLNIPGEQALGVSLEGSIDVDLPADKVSFKDLDVQVTGATPQPLELALSGTFALSKQIADTKLSLSMGEVKGNGKLRYASYESPQIDADLKLNLFDPVLFALAGPEAAAEAGDTEATTGDEPLPLDALRAIDTKAQLLIETARFDAHNIKNLKVNMRVNEGVANLRKIKGKVHGGTIDASAKFSGRHTTGTLTTKGRVTDLDLDRAMTAAETPDLVSGTATLEWKLSSEGKTVNEMTEALKGPIQLKTKKVLLKGTSIENMLCKAVALTNKEALTTEFSPDTQFTKLSAKIRLKNGRAKMDPLRAELAHVKLVGTGNYELLSQNFNATFKGRLSPELEQLDRACRVSKRLTSIDFPVECAGNIAAEPGDLCKVDSQKILKDLTLNEGKRKLEKEAGDFLNKLIKK